MEKSQPSTYQFQIQLEQQSVVPSEMDEILEKPIDKLDFKQIDNKGIYDKMETVSPSPSPEYISPQLHKDSFFARKVYPLEVYWENLSVVETKKKKVGLFKYEKESTTILHNLKGCCKPNTMTSILGPSGNDKTILLNLLSGKLTNPEMSATGTVKFNNVESKDPQQYSNLIAYIQQDDILFAVFTPREAFQFASKLRLEMSDWERNLQIDSLIKDLGLTKCADTRIGNVMLRGISGGERKRTSIGVELLTNPSIIFLDEPTTGLDSSTAFNVMDLLKKIAMNGRTVITTIHQPSCDIFNNFDQLILIVEGKMIYSGNADKSLNYFSNIGYPCKKFSNPADYFVQIMTPDGFLVERLKKEVQEDGEKVIIDREQIEQDFQNQVQFFVSKYLETQNYKSISANENAKKIDIKVLKKENKISFFLQFYLILKRTVYSAIKNPYETRMKFCQYLIFALLMLVVYYDLGTGRTGIQNRNGGLFFLSMNCLYGGVFGVLSIFSLERPLYKRESMNKSYSPGPYFLGVSLADIPFQILYMTVTGVLAYFPLQFNQEKAYKFFIFYLILNLTYFVAASYGYLISTIISNYELAVSILPVTIIPQTLLSGYMASQDQIPSFLKPIQYISIPKYTYQAMDLNEYQDISSDKLYDPQYCGNLPGKICDPLGDADFNEGLWANIIILLALGIGLRILAFIGLKVLAQPKRITIQ